MDQESVNAEVATAAPGTEQKPSDKEVNLRRLAQAKERAELERDQERAEKTQLLQKIQQMESRSSVNQEDEDDFSDDSYVEAKKLKKTLSKFEQRLDQKIEQKAEARARQLLEEDKQKNFMFRVKAECPDFDEVVTDEAANKFQEKFPEWAAEILQNKDEYKRRKLAYEAIKGLGFHQKKQDVSAQQRAEQNQKNMYYTNTGIGSGTAPMGDFTEAGKKTAYENMRSLMSKVRGR